MTGVCRKGGLQGVPLRCPGGDGGCFSFWCEGPRACPVLRLCAVCPCDWPGLWVCARIRPPAAPALPTHFKRGRVHKRMHSNARACTPAHAHRPACAHARVQTHSHTPAHACTRLHTRTGSRGPAGVRSIPQTPAPIGCCQRAPCQERGLAGRCGDGQRVSPCGRGSWAPPCPLNARKQPRMGERGSPDGSPRVTVRGEHQPVGASQPGHSCSLTFWGGETRVMAV